MILVWYARQNGGWNDCHVCLTTKFVCWSHTSSWEKNSMGAITLMHTQVIVTNVWFCVSNILLKIKKLQMDLLSHNVIFNVLVYIP
jgi:hypothetical protein